MNSIISSLASDNLYKFIALFGLALLLTPTFTRTEAIKLNEEIMELISENEKSYIELQMQEIDLINNQAFLYNYLEILLLENPDDDLVLEIIQTPFFSDSIDFPVDDFDEDAHIYSQLNEMLIPRMHELRSHLITYYPDVNDSVIKLISSTLVRLETYNTLNQELNINSRKLQNRIKTETALTKKKKIYRFSGIGITLIGFFLWYIRHQRFLDIELRNATLKKPKRHVDPKRNRARKRTIKRKAG